jgi:hypothetical protein
MLHLIDRQDTRPTHPLSGPVQSIPMPLWPIPPLFHETVYANPVASAANWHLYRIQVIPKPTLETEVEEILRLRPADIGKP